MVVPGDMAKDQLFAPGHNVFCNRADEGGLQEDLPPLGLRVPKEEQREKRGAYGIGVAKFPIDQGRAALPVAVGNNTEDLFNDSPEDGTDEEDPKHFIRAEMAVALRVIEMFAEILPGRLRRYGGGDGAHSKTVFRFFRPELGQLRGRVFLLHFASPLL